MNVAGSAGLLKNEGKKDATVTRYKGLGVGMKCPNPDCGHAVRPHEWHCVVCLTDCGFPNVRAARVEEEVAALADRVAEAERQAAGQGAVSELVRLRDVARQSRAVRVRSVDEVFALVKSDNKLLGTFYDLKGAGLLRPEATEIEAARQSAEPLALLNYHEQIQFAALTADDRGLFSYGNCAMVLDESKIAHRATVFEENCVLFCQHRGVSPANPVVPPGFRATWEKRDDLVIAKLGSRLAADMTDEDVAGLLLSTDEDSVKDDFVEVHIYGRIHRHTLSCVTVKLRQPGDRALAEAMRPYVSVEIA
ncbi:MAG: hypothetical protein U0Q16_28425 [Bryobacteraceae bacterium]